MRDAICSMLLGCAATLFAEAAAQPSLPRTADGKPDLHGYWLSGFLTPLQRPTDLNVGLVVSPDQQAGVIGKLMARLDEGDVYDPEFDSNPVPRALLEMNGELRSSLLVEPADGQLPLTSLAKAVLDSHEGGFDNPEDRPDPERCVGGFVNAPIAPSWLLVPLQIVQTPDAILLAMEDMEPARIVPLSGPASPAALRSRSGLSRGRWEGDTLVVETDRFSIASSQGLALRGDAYITADSIVIERFSLMSPDTLRYAFTIEDPSLYNRPWRAEYVFRRIPRPVYEYACHEGNHALIHILTAARMGRQEEPRR